MPCQIGNEAARDPVKHCAVYVVRSALGEIIASANPITSIHYDRRGAKFTISYLGADCADLKGQVEDYANSICEQNLDFSEVKLNEDDAEDFKSFQVLKSTAEVGGVTVKKLSVNIAKEQLVLEFSVGAPKKQETQEESKTAIKAILATKSSVKAAGLGYDSVQQVTDQLLEDLFVLLKEEGVALPQGKEDSLRVQMSDRLQTPLTLLKNTAYTRGFKSHISEPVSNFVVKR